MMPRRLLLRGSPVRLCAARPAWALLAAAGLAVAADPPPVALAQAALPEEGRWHFDVTLDDKPVGEHRFDVRAADGADGWQVQSTARYRVTLLGIPVYRYTHEARERWQGGCLRQLDARTDDNGKPLTVRAESAGPGLRVQIGPAVAPEADTVAGCLMSYAYWRPDLVRQTRLLNPQTGRVEAVRFQPAGTQTWVVDGRPQAVQGWQLTVDGKPLQIWYLPSGRWVGLDATVAGGRVLRYRLAG